MRIFFVSHGPRATAPHRFSVMRKPSLLNSLVRSQIVAALATVCDFFTLILLTEVAGLYYVWSAASGAFAGATVSFLLGRHWAFAAADGRLSFQIYKYAAVSAGSLVLNTLGVYVLTDFVRLAYPISRIFAAIFIGLTYNFLLQRYFVFGPGR